MPFHESVKGQFWYTKSIILGKIKKGHPEGCPFYFKCSNMIRRAFLMMFLTCPGVRSNASDNGSYASPLTSFLLAISLFLESWMYSLIVDSILLMGVFLITSRICSSVTVTPSMFTPGRSIIYPARRRRMMIRIRCELWRSSVSRSYQSHL